MAAQTGVDPGGGIVGFVGLAENSLRVFRSHCLDAMVRAWLVVR
ncbi:hypothetical protein [Vogesella oryzae]|nr:hypothetical protein [Vogesella oryzae]